MTSSSGKGSFSKFLGVINVRSDHSQRRNRRENRKELEAGSPSSALSVERPAPPLSAPDDETDDVMLRARVLIKLILEDDPEFRLAAPPFVVSLCKVETDEGADTVSNPTGRSRWLQKAVDFVAPDEQQSAVKVAKSFFHEAASAGAQGDTLSEKLKSMLVCIDKVVEIVDDFVEVHALVKITWTLAIYGYKVDIFLTLSANTTK
ncbi:hypothetical protein HK405_003548 [Cladochytrium tenue]|nr:hypothetical protein HK405_003548 [Cladochytrium tenue]